MLETLISPADLAARLEDPALVICDCRFELADPAGGEAQFASGHIPGARYVHLDRDLSGAKTGTNGRHPLPSLEQMAARFGALGVGTGTQVVAYDADSGMFAARLWWMLRFMGHDAVAVLDGGLARWQAEGHPVSTSVSEVTPQVFDARPRTDWRLDVEDVARGIDGMLVDARSPDRFHGLNETLDQAGGHIPGACNHFFQQNLNPDKTFKSPETLRAEWTATLQGRPPADVVMYCGSGVTACHNLLALEVAGLAGARIFPGSWSEWSASGHRPVET